MMRGGRPRDPIWEFFFQVEDGGKTYAKCENCSKQQTVKAQRMREHHKKCGFGPAAESAHVPESKSRKRPADELTAPVDEAPPSKKALLQTDLFHSVHKTTGTLRDQLDEKVASLFYGCNIPFSVAEHPLFLDLIQTLRPGYKPPTRKALGEKHLDSVTEKLKGEMKEQLEGKMVTLVEDGWSNIHNDPVVATCLNVGGKSFFLDAKDTGSMTKSAENCKKLCQDSIAEATSSYGCTVRNIVTDNAKNMEKMRTELQKDDPALNVYGCSAHWLNLLGVDITPTAIMKHVVEVQKYFRNHHKPAAWLKECSKSVKPQLPGDTRWKSQLTSLDTFLSNRPHFIQIAQEHEDDIDNAIIKKVMD